MYVMKIFTICFLLFTSKFTYAFTSNKTRTITGTVRARETNIPLAKVIVTVKGTFIGVQTDKGGNYKIKVPNGYKTLVFKCKGYKSQQVKIKTGLEDVLNIELMTEVTNEIAITNPKSFVKLQKPYSINSKAIFISGRYYVNEWQKIRELVGKINL